MGKFPLLKHKDLSSIPISSPYVSMCNALRAQKRMADALERKLQVVVSHDMSVGHQTQVLSLCKSSECSYLPRHPSKPLPHPTTFTFHAAQDGSTRDSATLN